eukprot:8481320-Alexandrium_andersonii.AAC.1
MKFVPPPPQDRAKAVERRGSPERERECVREGETERQRDRETERQSLSLIHISEPTRLALI